MENETVPHRCSNPAIRLLYTVSDSAMGWRSAMCERGICHPITRRCCCRHGVLCNIHIDEVDSRCYREFLPKCLRKQTFCVSVEKQVSQGSFAYQLP